MKADNTRTNGGTSPVLRLAAQNRAAVQLGLDALAWALALTFGSLVRHDLLWSNIDAGGLALAVMLAVVLQTIAGVVDGLYTGRWRFGSFDEVAALVRASGATTVVLFGLVWWIDPRLVPLSVPLAGGVAALLLMAGVRYAWRLARERMLRPSPDGATRLLVFGAGEGAAQVVTAMLRDPASPYVPVALIDDDPKKQNLRIMGVPVVGGRDAVREAARHYRADALLVAIPSATAELIGELADVATKAKLQVKVLPSVGELLGTGPGVRDIRPLTAEDLMGRREIQTDVESIAGYLTDRKVLVTGAGGSIGSELCRQVFRFAPAELIMVDRDESALHAVQLSIDGRGQLDSPDLVLCDIRDKERVRQIFEERRPDVVFHAAALKHVPLLEQHPEEAVKTNVFGTLHVLEAAHDTGVERFVNISTDKAADPINVLGYTKRICERLTAWFSEQNGGIYLSVRFGNVLGSRGSVLETFRKQIEAGGPVTVTHPDATRYFMTVEEAVQLVVQAGAIGDGGEVLVLDMGKPVKIHNLAVRLASQSERTIDIVYTGLRKGEKLQEQLLAQSDSDNRRIHSLISHVAVPTLEPSQLLGLSTSSALLPQLSYVDARALPL